VQGSLTGSNLFSARRGGASGACPAVLSGVALAKMEALRNEGGCLFAAKFFSDSCLLTSDFCFPFVTFVVNMVYFADIQLDPEKIRNKQILLVLTVFICYYGTEG